MKGKFVKKALCFAMSAAIIAANVSPVYAAGEADQIPAVSEISDLKDHWNFETLKSDMGDETEGTLNGSGVSIADSGDQIFGKVLRFGSGTDNFLKLENYVNTGSGATSFSMWYRYDTKIQEEVANASAVLLQHEGAGRSLLTLKQDGHYHTFINGTDVLSNGTVNKGDWQHITVVFDQTAGKVSYYVNGELDSQKDLGTQKVNQVLTLRLGAHKESGKKDPHPMRGDVDEFYVFNKALTAEEAKAVYEEKAKELYAVNLQERIAEAQELYDSGKLPESSEQAEALKAALEAAGAAKTLAEMQAAYEQLGQAIKSYEAEIPIGLTLNLDKEVRKIDADSIFGINHRYAFNGYGTFDSNAMKVKDDFRELYEQAGFGSIRYPGGTISNLFNWKTTLGPKEERKKQIHGFYNNSGQGGIEPNFGIKEIADFADQVNSEIVYVYSLGRGSVQDAEDLVEFLNAKVGTNPNGGIDWAQVRADNGHIEPYNVRYFEIGNEMNLGGDDGTASQEYWTKYADGKGVEDAYIEGATIKMTDRYTVKEEDWNKVGSVSDGSPNQVRYLRYANVNPGGEYKDRKIIDDPNFKAMEQGVQVKVGTDGNLTPWEVVENFDNSTPTDKHCVVDYSTGAIKFGDGEHGKIPDQGNNIYATYSVKRDGFIDISKAIKETTAKINEKEGKNYVANVYTSYETNGFITKMDAKNANEWYDGMTIHPYSDTVSGGSNQNAFYDNAMKYAEERGIGKVKNKVKLLEPRGKVPVISEFGIYYNTESQVRSQTHAVYIAKVMMEYVRLGSPYIQKHCLSDWYSTGADALGPTQQAVIQVVPGENADKKTGEGEFSFFATPSAHVFQMLNKGFGDSVIETTLEKEPVMSNGVKTLSALASVDENQNIYLALVNVDREKDQSIVLNLTEGDLAGREMEIQRLESEGVADENSLADPDKVSVKTEVVTAEANPVIRLKKHSVVVVKLSTKEAGKADYTAVDEALEKIPEDLSIYTEESVNNLKAAENAVVRDLASSEQARVDKMAKDIEDAIKALVKKSADYTAVDEALEKIPEDLSIYTEESVNNLKKAEEAVVRDLDITEQARVDKMAKDIEDAIKDLVKIPGEENKADYSAVDAALKKIPADLSVYTEESVRRLNEARNAVVRDLDSSKQAEVDQMAKNLEDAINALERKAGKNADYSKVDAALKKIPKDLSIYTDASVRRLNEARNAVVWGLDSSRQAEVDLMAKNIEDAINALVRKPATVVKTGDVTNVWLLVMAIIVSGAVCIVVQRKRRDY